MWRWKRRTRHLPARTRFAGVSAKQTVRLSLLLKAGKQLLRMHARMCRDDSNIDTTTARRNALKVLGLGALSYVVLQAKSRAETRHGQSIPPRSNRTIESFTDEECVLFFRFKKQDLPDLFEALQIPEVIQTMSGHRFSGEEVMLASLYRLAYPTRLQAMPTIFGREYSQWSRAFAWFVDHCWSTFSHLLLDGVRHWQPLFPACARAIRSRLLENGLALPPETDTNFFSICAFIDCTIRATCRPGGGPVGSGGVGAQRHNPMIQRSFFQGWKKLHGLKWQAVVLPNGIIADCWGPVSARHNDLYALRLSSIHARLVAAQRGQVRQYRLYGDGIYPVLSHLTRRHAEANATAAQVQENRQMSKTRESVEWTFAKIVNMWKYVDARHTLQLLSQPIGKIFGTAALLTNAHTCIYGSQVSEYFHFNPPSLRDYFSLN